MSIFVYVLPIVALSAISFLFVLYSRLSHPAAYLLACSLIPSLLPVAPLSLGHSGDDVNAPWGIFVSAYTLAISIPLNAFILIAWFFLKKSSK